MAHQRGHRYAHDVQQLRHPFGVRGDGHGRTSRRVAAAVSEQIKHQDAVSLGESGQQILPQMRGGEGPMDEDDRLADPA